MKDEEKYWLGMKLIDELDNRFHGLLKHFGSVEAVWGASVKELLTYPKIDSEKARSIMEKRSDTDLEEAYLKLQESGVKMVTLSDSDYPPLLKEIHHPPPVLFVKGRLVFDYGIAVAIVGARCCTPQGRFLAEEFGEGLSSVGITVVSGLARGVDSAAHHGALRGAGKTIAVIGSGLDIIYPPENRSLFKQICEEGAVISEYPLGTPPLPANFPVRNRIISGLAHGLVVVEAREKSGALITANLALEQNRDVMAVPGSVRSPQNRGTNRLLKNGACLVETVEDVLNCLNLSSLIPPVTIKPKVELSDPEKMILQSTSGVSKHFDELILETGLSIGEVASALTTLEVKGLVKKLPGNLYLCVDYSPDMLL